jgi:hypothetical protein
MKPYAMDTPTLEVDSFTLTRKREARKVRLSEGMRENIKNKVQNFGKPEF